MKTTRRDMLSAALGLSGLGFTGQLFAAPASSTRFLLVFLRGGYDCANLLVPYSSADYYDARRTIAVLRPDPAVATGAMALDADWALAPAVRESMGPLYRNRQLAFIPFAGTEDLSRSHFETQDSIELGQPVGGARDLRSGFLARLVGMLEGAGRPMSFTEALPLTFQGQGDIPNLALRSVSKPAFDDRQSALLASLYEGHRLQSVVASGLELRAQVSHAMAEEMTASSRNAVSTNGFELEASRMARLMRDQYRVGFVDIGGWDTHVNEGGAKGALASNLESLGRGLASYAQAMGPDWANTTVVVVSEFGRTFRENGNGGTDHGHGSVYWVLGGAVRGGRVCGEQVPVRMAALFQNRDYPVLNDYRTVLAGLFEKLWGLRGDQLEQVFPGVVPRSLQLV
jgi:uncharacterized protein (DUF1501 family)